MVNGLRSENPRGSRSRPQPASTPWQAAIAATALLLVGAACSLLAPGTGPSSTAAPSAGAQDVSHPTDVAPDAPAATEADAPAQTQLPPMPSTLLPPDLETITAGNADSLRLVAELGASNVLRVWFAPDTSKLAAILVNQNFRVSGVGMWDLASGEELFGLEAKPSEIIFAPDGQSFALAFPTKGIEVYDSAGGNLLSSQEIDFNYAAYSPSWDRVAVSSFDGVGQTSNVRMLDRVSGSEEWSIEVEDQVMGLEFLPDGETLFGVVSHGPGEDGTLMCWVAASGQGCARPPVAGLPAFSSDGRLAAAPGDWIDSQEIEVYEAAGWTRVSQIGVGEQPAHHIGLSANGEILGAEIGYRLKLWEARTGQELLTLPDQLINFRFSPDGRLIAAWDSLGSLKLYGVTPQS